MPLRLGQRSREPARREKAILNPSAGLEKYETELLDAVDHWQRETERAERLGNAMLLNISQSILGGLTEPINTWNNPRIDPEVPGNGRVLEQARRLALSTLGVSMLLRNELANADGQTTFEPEEAAVGPDGELGIIMDMVVDRPWKDFRVHAPIVIENTLPPDATEQWFRLDDLWVRQARPAEPTSEMRNDVLPARGANPDWPRFQTIFPYVATR
jgi:hypothetical protein